MKQPRILYKDRALIYRYPKTGTALLTGACLLILFSRPIYDLCIRSDLPTIDVEELKRSHKSRFDKS